jgi:hypothetical protein
MSEQSTPAAAAAATETLGMTSPSAAEAAARLDVLTANPEWTAKMLGGSGPQVKEFQELVAAKMAAPAGDRIDKIINGTIERTGFEVATEEGQQISTQDQVQSAAWLREAGISDGAIREVLEGRQFTREEYEASKRLSASRYGNADWVSKLLAGDHDARRELILMNIIKVNGYAEEKVS